MICECELCIYQENGNCTLNEAHLDMTGTCTDCIYLIIPDKKLKELKAEKRKALEVNYNNW